MQTVDAQIARRTFAADMAKRVQSLRDAAYTDATRQDATLATLTLVGALLSRVSDAKERELLQRWCDTRLQESRDARQEQAGRLAMGDIILGLLQAEFEQSGALLNSIKNGLDSTPASKAAKRARKAKAEHASNA